MYKHCTVLITVYIFSCSVIFLLGRMILFLIWWLSLAKCWVSLHPLIPSASISEDTHTHTHTHTNSLYDVCCPPYSYSQCDTGIILIFNDGRIACQSQCLPTTRCGVSQVPTEHLVVLHTPPHAWIVHTQFSTITHTYSNVCSVIVLIHALIRKWGLLLRMDLEFLTLILFSTSQRIRQLALPSLPILTSRLPLPLPAIVNSRAP